MQPESGWSYFVADSAAGEQLTTLPLPQMRCRNWKMPSSVVMLSVDSYSTESETLPAVGINGVCLL